jgi:hypothetical protein
MAAILADVPWQAQAEKDRYVICSMAVSRGAS